MNLELLQEQGFDLSYHADNALHVCCSQCEALVINGVACHEAGCPNHRRAQRDEDDVLSDWHEEQDFDGE